MATKPRPRRVRKASTERHGLEYGSGLVGKHRFRIRERHIAEHLIPLMTRRQVGAAKLDLLLRGIALPPDIGQRPQAGVVLQRYRYEQLYDVINTGHRLGAQQPGQDPPPSVLRLKRKWVRDQLLRLEALELVVRTRQKGRRSHLRVLSDDGSGGVFDDPDGSKGNLYITVLGSVIASGKLADWGAPELSAYLAAMVAERYAPGDRPEPGTGRWFRSLGWFRDVERYGPKERTATPFGIATLERGLAKLEEDFLITHTHITKDPYTKHRLQGRRNLYRNRFADLDKASKILKPADLADQLLSDDDEH